MAVYWQLIGRTLPQELSEATTVSGQREKREKSDKKQRQEQWTRGPCQVWRRRRRRRLLASWQQQLILRWFIRWQAAADVGNWLLTVCVRERTNDREGKQLKTTDCQRHRLRLHSNGSGNAACLMLLVRLQRQINNDQRETALGHFMLAFRSGEHHRHRKKKMFCYYYCGTDELHLEWPVSVSEWVCVNWHQKRQKTKDHLCACISVTWFGRLDW